MKLLRKLFNYIKRKADSIPKLSLCYTRIKIDPVSQKPYFLIGPILTPRGEATDRLYLDDLKEKMDCYRKLFSSEDWIIIQYNLGGIESLQISGTYQIFQFDIENTQIAVINKATLEKEIWSIVHTVSKKQYLNLDKQSIFELGMFYQATKTSNSMQEKIQREMDNQLKDDLYLEKFKDLQMAPSKHLNHVRRYPHSLSIVK